MAYVLLAIAIIVEVFATSLLKSASSGNVVAIVAVVSGYLTAFGLLAIVVRSLEVGVTYAIWGGTGTGLVATIGILVLGESVTPWKMAGLTFVIAGVILLSLSGEH
jgi:small multidrug resistance pump